MSGEGRFVPSGWPGLKAVIRRELGAYFTTPLAWVFLAAFAFAAPAFAFNVGRFFDTNRADLAPLFAYLPWLLMILMPALAMRAWAEERELGTIETLLSLPMPLWAAALGKFLAAWAVAGLALVLTFPMWIAVNWLGAPDNAAIAVAYVGALLLAGAHLAIGQALSAVTPNQVVAFVLGVLVAFLLTMAGLPFVTGALSSSVPAWLVEAVAHMSALDRYAAFENGVARLPDLVYFLSLIAGGVTAAGLIAGSTREGGR
ncbi:ABC transporter permease [Hyphobacterium sp. SN044]|uniref:ABC transporter permease n=1 Tax=Hyphobacterium sp. SN044 TaxID=2912575 RepID=UPI001F386F4E|nr:ABC transporter permease [Hyphobacterium sp. SN044]MCF8881020.1 ABC transporter permease [Hyphobacterium sp. SN044]